MKNALEVSDNKNHHLKEAGRGSDNLHSQLVRFVGFCWILLDCVWI